MQEPNEKLNKLCEELASTSSHLGKKAILLQKLGADQALRELFRKGLDPNDPAERIAVGVGVATFNELFPTEKIQPFSMMVASAESPKWEELRYHLTDAKNWYISGDPLGIHCLYENGTFKTANKTQLLNVSHLKFETGHVLDGRLVCLTATTIPQVYEAYLSTTPPELSNLRFEIMDCKLDLSFEDRLDVLDKMDGFVEPQLIDYDNLSGQLAQLRAQGFYKVLLRYGRGVYRAGVSRDVISVKL